MFYGDAFKTECCSTPCKNGFEFLFAEINALVDFLNWIRMRIQFNHL